MNSVWTCSRQWFHNMCIFHVHVLMINTVIHAQIHFILIHTLLFKVFNSTWWLHQEGNALQKKNMRHFPYNWLIKNPTAFPSTEKFHHGAERVHIWFLCYIAHTWRYITEYHYTFINTRRAKQLTNYKNTTMRSTRKAQVVPTLIPISNI